MISIVVTTGAGIPRNPISGIPVNTAVNTTLKISFQLNTAVGQGGTWILCAGTAAEFAANTVGLQLASVTAAGLPTLTIIDTNRLSGRLLYIVAQGAVIGPSRLQFTIGVE